MRDKYDNDRSDVKCIILLYSDNGGASMVSIAGQSRAVTGVIADHVNVVGWVVIGRGTAESGFQFSTIGGDGLGVGRVSGDRTTTNDS